MAKRRKSLPILLAGLDDCLLGKVYPLPNEEGIPVALYSGDMIAARIRDQEAMTQAEALAFVTDRIELNYLGPGTPRIVWAATSEDFGEIVNSE